MSKSNGRIRGAAEPHPRGRARVPYYDSWSACQANINPDEKECMATYFAAHDFLVRVGRNGAAHARGRAAHVFVAPGTTPNTVLKVCLTWMKDNWNPDPFTVTWYPLGGLIPATLFEFKQKYGHCSSGARLFLLPGEVDPQSETMTGDHTVEFLQKLDRDRRKEFNLSILSAHRFNMTTGDAYFYFDNEVQAQHMGATIYAEDKFLFLHPEKFSTIGGTKGYNICDLLKTSRSVTIYTVTSDEDNRIRRQFEKLCDRLLIPCPRPTDEQAEQLKGFRLCVVRPNGESQLDLPHVGLLNPSIGPNPVADARRDVPATHSPDLFFVPPAPVQ